MSSRTLYRLSGVALLIGGIVGAIAVFFLVPGVEVAQSAGLALFFATGLSLLGLPVFYAQQSTAIKIPGLISLLGLWFGLLMNALPIAIAGSLIIEAAHSDIPGRLWIPVVGIAGFLLLLVGSIAFAVVTLLGRVFPRWPAITSLILIVVVIVVSFIPGLLPAAAQQGALPASFYIAFALYGYTLLFSKNAATQRARTVQEVAPARGGADTREASASKS